MLQSNVFDINYILLIQARYAKKIKKLNYRVMGSGQGH